MRFVLRVSFALVVHRVTVVPCCLNKTTEGDKTQENDSIERVHLCVVMATGQKQGQDTPSQFQLSRGRFFSGRVLISGLFRNPRRPT